MLVGFLSNWFDRTLSVASFIISILAVIVSYKAIESNELIAEKSGVFDKPNLIPGISNFMFTDPNDTISIIYGCSWSDNVVNTATLPFTVCNVGKKDAENVRVIFETPKHFFIKDSLAEFISSPFCDVQRKTYEDSHKSITTHTIPSLPPGLKLLFEERFIFEKTKLQDSVEVILKDSSKVYISYELMYSMLCSASIISKDNKPSKAVFSISCVEANNMDNLIDISVAHINNVKKSCSFVIYPDMEKSIEYEGYKFNSYIISDNSIKFIVIKEYLNDNSFLVLIYDNDNRLEQIREYDKNNKLIKIL